MAAAPPFVIRAARTSAWIVVLALALLPVDVVQAGPTLCVWRATTGVECPGCGMTRAASLFLHGEVARAHALNRGVLLVVPIGLGLLAADSACLMWRGARRKWPGGRRQLTP